MVDNLTHPDRIVPFCTESDKCEVFEAECKYIQDRRTAMMGGRGAEPLESRPTTKNNIVGLCLSGGGIRSATFNLGFMQALYKAQILQKVDYLSTVSGGGYIGSCLTSLLSSGVKNEPTHADAPTKADPDSEDALHQSQEDQASLQQGQGTSKATKDKTPYLWRDRVFPFWNPFLGKASTRQSHDQNKLPFNAKIAEMSPLRHLRYYSNYLTAEGGFFQKYLGPAVAVTRGLLFNFIMIAAFIFLMASAIAAVYPVPQLHVGPFRLNSNMASLMTALAERDQAQEVFDDYIFTQTQHLLHPMDMTERVDMVQNDPSHRSKMQELRRNIHDTRADVRSYWWAMFTVPLLALAAMMIFYALLFIVSFFRGVESRLQTRFALNKVFSFILFVCLAIVAIKACKVILVYWEHYEWDRFSNWSVASLLTFLGPLLLRNGDPKENLGQKPWFKMILPIILLALTPLVLLFFTLLLAHSLVFEPCALPWMSWLPFVERFSVPWRAIAKALAFGTALYWITNNWLNINKISLHGFYRDRLCRAYLIKAQGRAEAGKSNPFERVVPDDSTTLSDLYQGDDSALGPYHIINANLNLKKDSPNPDGEAINFRKGESFIFSKFWCGSDDTGYVETPIYEQADHHINLGTAMAISGAAVNIGMGEGDKPTLRLLMGLLNVRLGYWALNPRRKHTWKSTRVKRAPGAWEGLCEWFGSYTLDGKYINLSDGGHFDNIGVYEMLRRRCKYIIVGDAEADPDMKFQALANLIRLAFIDFSIIIEIDISGLKKNPDTKLSGQHCVMGTIKYPKIGEFKEEIGYLFYCKSSMTGDEPAHLYEYRINHPDFPHQSTADQWFDERQFEVYRELGYHVGYDGFFSAADMEKKFIMEELFTQVKQYWRPRIMVANERFARYAEELNGICAQIKADERLAFMDSQIYPEWEELMLGAKQPPVIFSWLPETIEERRAGFYACNQMIQLMENVYLGLNLDKQHDHPDNRGWMNLFRHWTWAGMFRVTWAISACTFGARFQTFCQRRLNLELGDVKVENWGRKYRAVDIEADDKQKFDPHPLDREALMAVMRAYGNEYEKILAEEYMIKYGGENRSCYGFNLIVPNPLNEQEAMVFCFGFAYATRRNGEIIIDYLRIQDHLRRMGLGRWALEKLLEEIVSEQEGAEAEKALHTTTGIDVLKRIRFPRPHAKRPSANVKLMNMLASVKSEIRQRHLNQ